MTTIKSKFEKLYKLRHFQTTRRLRWIVIVECVCVHRGQFVLIASLQTLARIIESIDDECKEFVRRVYPEMASVVANNRRGRISAYIPIRKSLVKRLWTRAAHAYAQEQLREEKKLVSMLQQIDDKVTSTTHSVATNANSATQSRQKFERRNKRPQRNHT